jgi:hypothetical protein
MDKLSQAQVRVDEIIRQFADMAGQLEALR